MMAVNAVKQLPDLISLGLPMVILEIHDLPDPILRVYPMRALLTMKDEAEGFREFAESRESEPGGIVPGQPEEFLGPHNDIIGDIMQRFKTPRIRCGTPLSAVHLSLAAPPERAARGGSPLSPAQ